MMMTPKTPRDLATMVAAAKGPLRIIGGGTRPVGAPAPGEVLSVAGLSGITLYEPGALTLVVQAGTPVAQVEAALEKENQRLAFEPMDHRTLLGTTGVPTMGGIAAANVSGPRRVAVGAARDFMLGVQFIDGSGTQIKNGGRVMKNVTGYDLVKLMAGSYGTLGVMTEVSLKVLPGVEAIGGVAIHGLNPAQAVAAMSAALGSPYDVTGAAHLPGEGKTLIRVEGFTESVTYRTRELRDLLGQFGELSEAVTDWTPVRDVVALKDHTTVWRISVRPSQAVSVLTALDAVAGEYDSVMDWGGGLIWIGLTGGDVAQVHGALQTHVAGIGGHATLFKAPDASAGLPRFQPEPAPLAAISNGLRAKFDPRGIFNQGIMG